MGQIKMTTLPIIIFVTDEDQFVKIKRIFLVLWVLCEQSQLQAALGDQLVELLFGLSEVTHLLL